jgi:hypothetical protein
MQTAKRYSNRSSQWMIVMMSVAALLVSACRAVVISGSASSPAQIEAIEGTDFNRLLLTEDAVTRLGLQTDTLREEQITRTRIVGGLVEALPDAESDDGSPVLVRVNVNTSDLDAIAPDLPALILPLLDEEGVAGITAQPFEPETSGDVDTSETGTALYFLVDAENHGLVAEQRVRVELTLQGSGTQRPVAPYAAVIYGLQGDTWLYTNPEPLTFVREPVTIDYIDGDLAILAEGPPAGTVVVTAGAAELYGTEFGVGK